MRRASLRRFILKLLVCTTTSIIPFECEAADIWFSATEPVWRDIRKWPQNDYMELFETNAPWQTAAKRVKVFEVSKRFVLDSSDDVLREAIDGLKERNIQLSVQATPLLASKECGLGVEGHGPADDMVLVAKKISRMGGTINYLRMDEPLYFGHVFEPSPHQIGQIRACKLPISEVARQISIKMKAVREIFPKVVVGDIEPMGQGSIPVSEWIAEFKTWLDSYNAAMGEPLGFFHADVVWLQPGWQPALLDLTKLLKEMKVPLGVIYNGTPRDQTDLDWINDAEQHFQTIERTLGVRPQHAVLQSWMDHPRSLLPERKVDAMTNLILRYSTWERSLDH